MRYFGGQPPETLRFGTPWPQGKFTWVSKSTEVAPGFHLIVLKGSWGVDLDVMEISLAIDTPEGTVLVVGCSHPTIEKIVEAAKVAMHKPIQLIVGGLHLLPAQDEEIQRIASALRDTWEVVWVAPSHCTGEPAFEILKRIFGERYIYAGLGTTVALDSNAIAAAAEHQSRVFFDSADRRTYRQLTRFGSDVAEYELGGPARDAHSMGSHP
jgi:7,8-dihydropterin-6-yl-methyl-4-(beta-D-ribofuranosyl)aminobenzene 5'-phosphate synthase